MIRSPARSAPARAYQVIEGKPGPMPEAAPISDRSFGALWDALCLDADAAITVCNRRGEIRYANEHSNRFYRWQRAVQAERAGAKQENRRNSVEDAAAPELIRERMEIFASVCDDRVGVAYESVVQGIRHFVTVRPVDCDNGETLALIVARRMHAWERVEQIADPALQRLEPAHHDPGILETLSTRELQVLILIAQGHTYTEIARILQRSVRTVERHRDRLGNKLKARNRVDLARFAIRAGLAELPDPGQAMQLEGRDYDPLLLSPPLRQLARRRVRVSEHQSPDERTGKP